MAVKDMIRSMVMSMFTVVYGVCVIANIFKMVCRHGFSKTFSRRHVEKPAALDDPKYGVHGYLHLEEVRIHYVASGPEDKPLMLFLHGFPEFWFSWRHQIEEFQKDYRVVAIDMRGYGDSDKPSDVKAYRMDRLTNDVRQVILALGYQKCVLVAHDWGGAVAWAFAWTNTDLVDRLIIMNAPPPGVMPKLFERNKKQLFMSWYIFFFQLPWLPELTMRLNDFVALDQMFGVQGIDPAFPGGHHIPCRQPSKSEVESYKFTFSQPGALTPPINYYRAIVWNAQNGKPVYDLNYPMPVLLIWGMKDFALHSDIPGLVTEGNPDIHVRTVPEAGHFVQNDCPQEVNDIMRNWLQQMAK